MNASGIRRCPGCHFAEEKHQLEKGLLQGRGHRQALWFPWGLIFPVSRTRITCPAYIKIILNAWKPNTLSTKPKGVHQIYHKFSFILKQFGNNRRLSKGSFESPLHIDSATSNIASFSSMLPWPLYEINTSQSDQANSRPFRCHQCFLWCPFSVPGSTSYLTELVLKQASVLRLSILPGKEMSKRETYI